MEEITPRRLDEIHNQTYQRYFPSWNQWLHQTIDPINERHHRIADIATTIYNSLNDKGYYLTMDKTTLFNKILVWAYTVDQQFYLYSSPELTMNAPAHRNLQKDRENYDHAFKPEFWNTVKSWADRGEVFATLHASSYFWANLPYFVYRFIDMDQSPYVKNYDEEEAKIDEEEIEHLIEEGILYRDKKGRIISASLRDNDD
jgi:hypothetical protein